MRLIDADKLPYEDIECVDGKTYMVVNAYDIDNAPTISVQPKAKTGHWIRITPSEIYECSECNQNVMTSDICAYKFCHGCGAKMESEELQQGLDNADAPTLRSAT